MKKISYALTIFFAALALPMVAQKENTRIYGFGFSGSFADSIVYITDVQTIDNVEIGKKDKFLIGRELYSDQLKSYLENRLGMENRTCVLIYSTNKNKLFKKYEKISKQYQKEQDVIVKPINGTDFTFTAISPTEE